jgi:PIN domain nuclease of toxin-antitoxin system
MRLLLDTHALIWNISNQEALSEKVLALIDGPAHDKFISMASLWEMAIKISLGKLKLAQPASQIASDYLEAGLNLLPITMEHIQTVANLPWPHRDPFDRMLIAQAQCEKLAIITQDARFRDYQVEVIW